uniref:Uncharacterized protein n=1 Tax=viral metagenome TaxID=1070528 RepID=A0A6C0BTA2_9ZZZZ
MKKIIPLFLFYGGFNSIITYYIVNDYNQKLHNKKYTNN